MRRKLEEMTSKCEQAEEDERGMSILLEKSKKETASLKKERDDEKQDRLEAEEDKRRVEVQVCIMEMISEGYTSRCVL